MEDLLKSLWELAEQIVGGGADLLIAIGAAEASRRPDEERKLTRPDNSGMTTSEIRRLGGAA
jgi:hypothetical protein